MSKIVKVCVCSSGCISYKYLSGKIQISLLESDSVPTGPSSPGSPGFVEDTHRLAWRLKVSTIVMSNYLVEEWERKRSRVAHVLWRGGTEAAKAVRTRLT